MAQGIIMSALEEFAFMTNEEFLSLPHKEQMGYLRRATEELAQKSHHLQELVGQMEKVQIAPHNVYQLPQRPNTANRSDKQTA